MGLWAKEAAQGDEDILRMLEGVPGYMCGRIDDFIGAHYSSGWYNNLPRKVQDPDEEAYEDLYAEAEGIEEDRERMRDGLEACRTACERLREALVDAINLYAAEKKETTLLEARVRELEDLLAEAE